MRILTLIFLTVLTALSAFGNNIDYRALNTNYFSTNAFYVEGMIGTNAATGALTNRNQHVPVIFEGKTNGNTRLVLYSDGGISAGTDWLDYSPEQYDVLLGQDFTISGKNGYNVLIENVSDPTFTNDSYVQFGVHADNNTNNSSASIFLSSGDLAHSYTFNVQGTPENQPASYIQWAKDGNVTFGVAYDGNLSKVHNLSYNSWPTVHGPAGSLLTDTDGAGTLAWLGNGYKTNFATTNTSTGLTNAILSIITNQTPNLIHGRTNYIAYFNPNTNEVSASILDQIGTTLIELRNGDTPNGSLAAGVSIYGNYTDSTHFDSLHLGWSVGNADYQIFTDKGSGGGSSRQLEFGVGGSTQWAIGTTGTHPFFPEVDNAYDLGGSSGRILDIYVGTGGIIGTIGNSGALNYRMSGGGGWWETGDQTSWQGSNGAEYMRLKKSTPSSLDLGLSPLAFGRGAGAGVGAVDTYILSPAANVIQFGTNDTASGGSAPPTQRLQASSSTGTDTPAATMQFAGGAPSGAGRAGDAAILTSTNGATGSAQRGFQTRTFISAHDVTLTESSPTLVLNVTVPASGYLGIRVMATTHADDASNFQSVTETFAIAAVNKAGTVTTSVSASAPTATLTSSGTLTTAWTAVANGASVDIKNNAVSSLTQTTLATKWRVEVDSDGPAVVVGQ